MGEKAKGRMAGKTVKTLTELKRVLDGVERGGLVRVNGRLISVRHPMTYEIKTANSLVSGELHIAVSWPQPSGRARTGSPLVGVLGGSRSDFPVLEKAVAVLTHLGVPSELLVVSAHRTPDRLFAYAEAAADRGIEVIVAGAGGAAHLPGMLAAKTHLPVIGVPIPTENLRGLDSLLSIVQMPRGIPVATVAIGGAENAGLLAAQILAGRYHVLRERLKQFREEQTRAVLSLPSASHRQPTSSVKSKKRSR
jgi:5-(carboxyamino)imidazole ribonucleotide mutase